ncbi:hypothetical protein [Bradyrhizobium sp. STM 3566]|uniref:hypothetical protein n=1 Tax=Bradyrhizobium sp. STM 3566 TaxID=578928 RepID=UPI00388F38B2
MGRFRRQAEVERSWPDPARNPTASEFEVDLWTLSSFLLEKLVPVVGTHPYPLNELLLMSAGSSTSRQYSVKVALDRWRELGEPKRPLFFVDCDHAYESVA